VITRAQGHPSRSTVLVLVFPGSLVHTSSLIATVAFWTLSGHSWFIEPDVLTAK
jgi:hypothetical protein